MSALVYKSIKNYEKKMHGTSDAWSMSCLSHGPSNPAYHIEDCRISSIEKAILSLFLMKIMSMTVNSDHAFQKQILD